MQGAEPGLADQGIIINYELSQLRTAVVQASEQHEKGLPLLNAKALNTAFVEYAKGCFDGSALLSMIVTLAPAPGSAVTAAWTASGASRPAPRVPPSWIAATHECAAHPRAHVS